MIRTLAVIVGVFCIAIVVTAALGIGLLMYRGHLTAENWQEIRGILSGNSVSREMAEVEEAIDQPSGEQIMQERVRTILQLNTREEELDRFRNMIDTLALELSQDKEKFRQQKLAFQQQLQQVDEKLTAEATEQARGILAKLRPDDAARSLMSLTLTESVVLVRGMPERLIGQILTSFGKSADQLMIDRGREIFESISRGEPDRSVLTSFRESAESAESGAGGPSETE